MWHHSSTSFPVVRSTSLPYVIDAYGQCIEMCVLCSHANNESTDSALDLKCGFFMLVKIICKSHMSASRKFLSLCSSPCLPSLLISFCHSPFFSLYLSLSLAACLFIFIAFFPLLPPFVLVLLSSLSFLSLSVLFLLLSNSILFPSLSLHLAGTVALR